MGECDILIKAFIDANDAYCYDEDEFRSEDMDVADDVAEDVADDVADEQNEFIEKVRFLCGICNYFQHLVYCCVTIVYCQFIWGNGSSEDFFPVRFFSFDEIFMLNWRIEILGTGGHWGCSKAFA